MVHDAFLWITAGNVLFLASYSVRDILWLRVLTVVATSLLIPYYALQPEPLMAAIAWNLVFIAINVYWIVKLSIERRPVRFTQDEARLHQLAFPSLSQRDARDLFDDGEWIELAPGVSIVRHDHENDRLSVIFDGSADVLHNERKIGVMRVGQFVGLIDNGARFLPLDVVACTPIRIMGWPRPILEAFVASRPHVALLLERSVDCEVRELLECALEAVS